VLKSSGIFCPLSPITSTCKPENLAELRANRDSDLEDFRHGAYCSGCGKTRSQWLAEGQPFPHPGERPVTPTQKEIDVRAAEWETKLNELWKSVTHEQRNINGQIAVVKEQQRELAQTIKRSMIDSLNAAREAGRMIPEEWDTEKVSIEARIKEKKKLLTGLDALQAKLRLGKEIEATKEMNQAYETQKNVLRGQLHYLSEDLQRSDVQRQLDKAEWSQKVLSLRQSFQRGGAAVGMYLSPPVWTAPELTLSAVGVGITVGQDKLGFSAGKAKLEAANDWLNGQQDLTLILESGAGQLGGIAGGMKRTTTWTPDGVVTKEDPFVTGNLSDALIPNGRKATVTPDGLKVENNPKR